MIYDRIGNLLCSTEVNVIVHQANLFHTFGAGLAKVIKITFPEAYEADLRTISGDEKKLGTYSLGRITRPQGSSIEYIVNLYSQWGIGGYYRNTSYDKMVDGLMKLREYLEDMSKRRVEAGKSEIKLGFPYKMGAGLANGDFGIVRAIIESVFAKSFIDVCIYRLPDLYDNKTSLSGF